MRFRRELPIGPAACRAAAKRLQALGYRPLGDDWVRGSLYGAVFCMDPRRWRARLTFEPDAGGTELSVHVETSYQVLTATERAYWNREVESIERLLLGSSLPLAPVRQHADLARVENWSITGLSFGASLATALAVVCAGGWWVVALLVSLPTLVVAYMGLLAWIRWRPLTEDERRS